MENMTCKSCGGSVKLVGNSYVCDNCQSKWSVDGDKTANAVEIANAWMLLRRGDFKKAAEMFDSILLKEKGNYECYWGRALALNSVLFVDDGKGKKVPVSNNLSEKSLSKDKDVQKALSLAPQEIKNSYAEQAAKLDKLNMKWLDMAAKEAPCDVFVSCLAGKEESLKVKEVCDRLSEAGYKVFYNSANLHEQVPSHKEPYIYNAIRTAKVMVVLGEKTQDFYFVPVRNEWTRFQAKIENGEKQKSGLAVAFKNMDATGLPKELQTCQTLNMDEETFIDNLKNYISGAMADAEKGITLEKIAIQGGQKSVQATELPIEPMQLKSIGSEGIAQIAVEDAKKLGLVNSLMKEGKWVDATKAVDEVLANNPTCGEAFWRKMLIANRVTTTEAFAQKLDKITESELKFLTKILDCAGEGTATKILDIFYASNKNVSEEVYCQILTTILPYEYKNREVNIKEAFKWSIQASKMQAFTLLFTTFNVHDVEKYIKYNCLYAKKTTALAEKKTCLDRVFKLDEGNMEALKIMLYLQLNSNARYTVALKTFEKVLQYSSNQSADVSEVLDWLGNNLKTQEDCALVKQFLKYDPEDISKRKDQLLGFAKEMIKCGYFEEAEYLSKLVLSFDKNNAEATWNLCLIQVRATSDDKIKKSKILLKNLPAYDTYLSLVEEPRKRECAKIVKDQHKSMTAKRRAITGVLIAVLSVAFVTVATVGGLVTGLVIVPESRYNKARDLLEQGKYEKAYEILEDLGDYKDAEEVLKDSLYERANEQIKLGNDVEAYRLLKRTKGYKDSNYLISEIRARVVKNAEVYAQKGKYQEVVDTLDTVDITVNDSNLYAACKLMLDGKYKEAVALGLTYVIIPEGVSTIEDSAFYNSKITTVELPRTLKKIGARAFERCLNLTTVTMYDGVTSIGDQAFYNTGLKSIKLSKNLQSIGASAFANCSSLMEILIPKSVTTIGSQAFYGCSSLEIYSQASEKPSGWSNNWNQLNGSIYSPVYWNYGGATGLTKEGFSWMLLADGSGAAITAYDGLRTEVEVPETIEGNEIVNIYANAFANKNQIKKIQLPETVTSIGASAFSGCVLLEEVQLPEGLIEIGNNAFEDCSSLNKLIIPATVMEMGDNVFHGCNQLSLFCQTASQPTGWASSWNKYDNYDACVTVWGCTDIGVTEDGFEWLGVQDGVAIIGYTGTKQRLSIPAAINNKKIIRIEAGVFKNNTTLTNVTIHKNVAYIGFGAFEGCTSLKTLALPFVGEDKKATTQNTYFGYIFGAKSYSENATKVPQSLYNVSLNDEAYYKIPANAFKDCNYLMGIELPERVNGIGKDAFHGCYRLRKVVNTSPSLTITVGGTDNGYVGCYTHEIITDAENCGEFIFGGNGYYFYRYPSGTCYLIAYTGTNTKLTLPEDADGEGAPYRIASYAFYNCNLTSVYITEKVSGIEAYAFVGNSNLTRATFDMEEIFTIYDVNGNSVTIDASDYSKAASYLRKTYVAYRWELW